MKAYLSPRLRRLIEAVIVTALVCTTALIAACGGGSSGGGNSPSTPVPPPVPVVTPVVRTAPLQYGYFGVIDDQIAETYGHVTTVMSMDWSDAYWSTPAGRQAIGLRIIGDLQAAKARGLKHAWVAVGFLVFTTHPGCTLPCYVPRTDLSELRTFHTQLAALGLDSMVTALYPVDEPELHGLTDATLTPLLFAIKSAWPHDLAVIYGDTHTYPGLKVEDIVGKDHYSADADVLNDMPPITGAQRYALIPGGSDPDRNDPAPFLAYAQANASVWGIVPFLWGDRPDGHGNTLKGIRDNGMAPAYVAVGETIKGLNP